MLKFYKMFAAVTLALTLLSSIASIVYADSVSFGGQLKQKSIRVSQGRSANFELFLFSRSEESPSFSLSIEEYPPEFTISYPESFDMNSDFLKEEFIVIDGEYFGGKIVSVNVKVPSYADVGTYDIVLKVESTSRDRDNAVIAVMGEQSYIVKVNVVEKSEGVGSAVEETGKVTVVGGEDIREDGGSSEASDKEETAPVTKEEESESSGELSDENLPEGRNNPFTGLASIITGGIGNVTILFFSFVIIIGVSYRICKSYGNSRQTNQLKNLSEKERYNG